jgi:hypothetical protein
MVALVERMLELHRKMAGTREISGHAEHVPKLRTEHDRTLVEREIRDTDARIDRLVYDLYALTPAEIALVKGKTEAS